MSKSKKFSFFPSDWLGGTVSMTPEERGIYIDLLCCQWAEGPLKLEQAIAAGRAEDELVAKVLAMKFHLNPDGTWQNNRLEQERQRAGRDKPRKAPRIDSGERSLIPGLELGQSVKVAEKPVLVFPCNGEPGKWVLESSQVLKWQDLYQGLDVIAECRKALAWVEANGKKTARGMPKFLVSWLGRAVDNGKGFQQTFKQRDNQERNRVKLKLKLEQLGLSQEDAARLSRIDERAAMIEAERLLINANAKTQEVIPW